MTTHSQFIPEPALFASDDLNCLRNKWILVCRASGVHRGPSYQRAASKGPWKPRHIITKDDALKHQHIWTNCLAPIPYQIFPDGTDNLETYQEGYGCRLIFLHPFKAPWVVEAGLADGWITGDGGNPEESWDIVSNWLATQAAMRHAISNSEDLSEHGIVKAENGTYTNQDGVQFVSEFPGTFHGCVTFDDFSISTASHIAEQLDLITTPRSVIEVIKNKYKLRQVCHQIGIPVPRSLIFRLNDLFLGKLDPILDPQPLSEKVQGQNQPQATFTPDKTLVPGQRLNLHNNQWLVDPLTNQPYSQVEFDDPHTPTEWEQYYFKKQTELAQIPLQYPLVIKPFSGAGSNFVRKAANYQELVDVFKLFYNQTKGIRPTNDVESAVSQEESSEDNISEEQLQLLRTKWKCWGLPDIDVSFMIEECIKGTEFDLDVLIQDSQIVYASINDNFPTAGHAQYFLEAGGIVQSGQPFKQQVAMRVMTNFVLKYFQDYFLKPKNEEEFGPCLFLHHDKSTPCHANTPFEKKCSVCQKYKGINGVWHFEGMIAKNMDWTKCHDYGIMSGYNQVSESNQPGSDINNDDYYVCMPIEINQRVGGSEVQCLSSICSGIEYAVDNIKLHTRNVRLPNYFSYLPQFTEMNRLGWDRFPDSPEYDPEQVFNPSPTPAITTKTQALIETQLAPNRVELLALSYQEDCNLSLIKFPSRPVATRPSILVPEGYDGLSYPMADIPQGENSGPQLHTHLPLPRNLLPKVERIPYSHALAIVHTYTNLLKLPTPQFYYPPADPVTGREVPRWRFATSINWAPSESGKLRSNSLPDHVINDPTYLGAILWWPQGYNLCFPPLGFDCLGWLTAGGNTPLEAHYHMLRLAAELRYFIEPLPQTPK